MSLKVDRLFSRGEGELAKEGDEFRCRPTSNLRRVPFSFSRALYLHPPSLAHLTMAYKGKTAIVTGSSSNRSLSLSADPTSSLSRTGGASGIGLGLTRHLLEQGCKVVIADVNAAAGAVVVEELGAE